MNGNCTISVNVVKALRGVVLLVLLGPSSVVSTGPVVSISWQQPPLFTRRYSKERKRKRFDSSTPKQYVPHFPLIRNEKPCRANLSRAVPSRAALCRGIVCFVLRAWRGAAQVRGGLLRPSAPAAPAGPPCAGVPLLEDDARSTADM